MRDGRSRRSTTSTAPRPRPSRDATRTARRSAASPDHDDWRSRGRSARHRATRLILHKTGEERHRAAAPANRRSVWNHDHRRLHPAPDLPSDRPRMMPPFKRDSQRSAGEGTFLDEKVRAEHPRRGTDVPIDDLRASTPGSDVLWDLHVKGWAVVARGDQHETRCRDDRDIRPMISATADSSADWNFATPTINDTPVSRASSIRRCLALVCRYRRQRDPLRDDVAAGGEPRAPPCRRQWAP